MTCFERGEKISFSGRNIDPCPVVLTPLEAQVVGSNSYLQNPEVIYSLFKYPVTVSQPRKHRLDNKVCSCSHTGMCLFTSVLTPRWMFTSPAGTQRAGHILRSARLLCMSLVNNAGIRIPGKASGTFVIHLVKPQRGQRIHIHRIPRRCPPPFSFIPSPFCPRR